MQSVSRCKPYLGTYVEISLVGELPEMELHELCSAAFSEVERIQHLMSFHEEDSELSKLNKLSPTEELTVSDDLLLVLSFAQSLHTASDGVFDIGTASRLIQLKALPQHDFLDSGVCGSSADLQIDLEKKSVHKTRPVTFDLGGIAKGYAVDIAFEFLSQQKSLSSIIINAGGDMRVHPHQGLEITLRPPNKVNQVSKVSPMLAQACATSASSFAPEDLNSFIIDPKDNQCINDSRSITVFAPCCMHADALTKVCFLTRNLVTLEGILRSYKAKYLEFS